MKKQKDNANQAKNPTNNNSHQLVKKQGRPLKEVVPATYSKCLRDNIPIYNPPNKISEGRNYYPVAQPFEIFTEWNEEEAHALNKECINSLADNNLLNGQEVTEFSDPMHFEIEKNLPLSLLQYCNFNVKWIRPKDYVKNFYLDKEIKMSYPKKNYVKMRGDIKDTYEIFKSAIALGSDNYEIDIDVLLAEDEESRKKNLYKYFYRILDREFVLKVVDSQERLETDEEYKKRREAEIQEKTKQEAMMKSSKKMKFVENKKAGTPLSKSNANEKNLHNATHSIGFIGYNEEKIICKIANPTNITVSEAFMDMTKPIPNYSIPTKMMNYNFAKWVGSVYQTIIDQNILDAYTDKPIWHNIYPQKDNFPIYNPSGRYIIKLYSMGKPRKIEIDDSMPCNSDDEYIIPFSATIEEIWPALFTKALIKLNMFKMKYPSHVVDEIGDCSIIYNLTGYIGQTVDLEKHNDEDVNFLKSLQDMLSDEIYCEKKKMLICFKKLSQQSENEIRNFEKKKSEIDEELEQPLELNLKKILKPNSLRDNKKKTVKSNTILIQEKLEMSSPRRFERSSTRKLSYNNVFLKNIIHVGVQSTNKRASIQNVFNSDVYKQIVSKEAEENNQNLINPVEEPSLTTGNSNLYYDFAYSISDFFDNENFNVKRLNQLDFTDLKQELKEFQLSLVYKQLNKEDKKKYITTLIELKNKEKEQKQNRLEELKKEGKKFNLVKIMNESYGNNSLNFYIPYTQEEILMVKKCLLNNWEFPPPAYFEQKYKTITRNAYNTQPNTNSNAFLNRVTNDIGKISTNAGQSRKSMKEQPSGFESILGISEDYSIAGIENKHPKHSASNANWNKESYMQLIDHDLDQFANHKEPVVRQNGGVWIHYPEFKSYFNRFIILHNPNKLYSSQLSSENPWNNWQYDTFEPNEHHSVFVLSQKENNFHAEIKTRSSMLLLFKPNSEKTFPYNEKIKSYIRFKIVDSDNNIIHEKVLLKSFFSTFHSDELKPDNNYFIIIDGGILPFGYFLQIFAESHNVTSISHNNYLKRYFEFQSFNLKIDHPSIEKNKFYILARFSIKCLSHNSEPMSVKFSLNYPDKWAKRFFELVCYKNSTANKKVLNFNEMINLKQDSNIYYFVLCVKPGFIMAENTLEFECLYDKKDVKIEHYDHVEGYEIMDKFTPNKQGVLFKEFIYSPDLVHASLGVKIQESRIAAQQDHLLPIVQTVRLGSSKEKNKSIPVQTTDNRPLLTPILDKIRLRLVLYKVKSLATITPNFDIPKEIMCQWEFFNETLIHHIKLEGVPWVEKPIEIKKGQKVDNNLNNNNPGRHNININLNSSSLPIPYLLVCYIDQTEAPEYLKDISGNLLRMRNIDIFWSIRVFSTDTLGFVKDTTKEDSEKILKVSWETNEQGRCEKSRKSRIRFLLQTKREKGAPLTREEEFILNEVRERKISTAPLLEEHKAPIILNPNNPGNKKGNTTNKKSENLKAIDRKGNSSSLAPIIPAVVNEPNKLELVKITPLPVPDKHVSDYIKNFLHYSYDERTHIFDNNLNQMQKLIVDKSIKEEKTKQIMKDNEEYEKSRAIATNLYTVNKSENSEMIKSFYKTSFSFRKELTNDTTKLIKARDHLKNEFQNKFEIEKNIRDVIANSGMQFDFGQAYALFKEYPTFHNYDKELVRNLHQIISLKKEENLRTDLKKFSGKDKITILKHLEDIKSNKLIISADLEQKLREIIK